MRPRSYRARDCCGSRLGISVLAVTRFHRNVNIAAVVLPFLAVLAAIPCCGTS